MTTSQMVLSFIVGPLIGGVLVFYLQSRIRVKETKDTAAIHGDAAVAAAPYKVLQDQLAAKDQQLAQVQGQHHDFVEGQMKRNDATTQAILALAEQVRVQTGNLKDIQTGQHEQRAESSARAGKTYEKIAEVNERLAGLEAGVKNCLETAQDAAKAAKGAAELAEKAVREVRAA